MAKNENKVAKISEARQQKAAQIEEIKSKIQNCKAMVIVDYKGISVADDTALRANFRKENVEYRVLKNRLVQIALNELGIAGFDGHLEGPTAVAFANGDSLAAGKPRRSRQSAPKEAGEGRGEPGEGRGERGRPTRARVPI